MKTPTRLPARTLLALACLMSIAAARAGSTIVRDNSLGTGPLNALVPLGSITSNGLSYARISIPESYGARKGGNLFHSFSSFDIAQGEAAVFGLSAATSNIVSRVTGGQASQIAGLLTVDAGDTGSRPNVYLINPAGVTFSAGAAVDVPAALHVGTADVITFADGRFEADPARASTLSSAAPAAFGFLGTKAATLTVGPGVFLHSAAGNGVTLAAGNVSIDNASVETFNGDLRLAAVGGAPASVATSGAMPAGLRGTLSLSGNADTTTYTAGTLAAGDVLVAAGEVRMGDGTGNTYLGSASLASATGKAGNVDIDATGTLSLDSGANILSTIAGAGKGGDVRVRATAVDISGYGGITIFTVSGATGDAGAVSVTASGAITLDHGGQIYAENHGTGGAGAVSLSAGTTLAMKDGSRVSSDVFGDGNAGGVSLAGRDIRVDNSTVDSFVAGAGSSAGIRADAGALTIIASGGGASLLGSDAAFGSSGNAGPVTLQVAGLFAMSGESVVSSTAGGAGNGGAIRIAAGSMELGGAGAPALIVSSAVRGSTGMAGTIELTSQGKLAMHDGALVLASTKSVGDAGAIRVQAGSMTVDGGSASTGMNSDAFAGSSGRGGDIDIAVAGQLAMTNEAQITAATSSRGNAGNIRVAAGSLSMQGQDTGFITGISNTARAGSSGNAGMVTLRVAGDLTLSNGGEIASSTYGAGAAGVVLVDAANVVIDNAQIVASALEGSSGQVGNLTVRATEAVTLRNAAYLNLQNNATAANPAALLPGTLLVEAPRVQLDGSLFSSLSAGNVTAGNIVVRYTDRLVMHDGFILTRATDGNGGAISIEGGKLLDMTRSSINTAVFGLQGNGGDIAIKTDVLLMQSTGIRADTSAAGASGGMVRIDARNLLSSGNMLLVGGSVQYLVDRAVFGFNVIQAAAPTGVSGSVALASPSLDIAGALAGLAVPLIDTGGLGRNPCQAGGASSLVQAGRGGLAPSARSLLGSTASAPLPLLQAGLAKLGCTRG
jgi:filamentous hemagglutinin family protein